MKSEWVIPFRNRSFTWFFIGQAVSALGDWAAYVIIPILIYHLTNDPASIGYLMICRVLPNIVLSPFIGRLMKKFSLLRVMVVADLVRGLLYLAFLIVQTPLEVYVLTCLVYAGTAFFNPGRYALIPKLVQEEALALANSYIGGVAQFAMLVGPAIGGVVFSLTSMRAGLIFNALTFFISMGSLLLVRLPREARAVAEEAPANTVPDIQASAPTLQKASTLSRFAKTFRSISNRKLLFVLLTVGPLANMGFGGMLTAMFPLLAGDVFHLPQVMYGAIMSLLGGGIFVGMMGAPLLLRKIDCYSVVIWSNILGGVFAAVFGGTHQVIVSLLMIFLVGCCNGFQDIADLTYVQQMTTEQGDAEEVFSLQQANWSTTFIIATLLATQLSAHVGPQRTVVTMSVFPVLTGMVMLVLYVSEKKEGKFLRIAKRTEEMTENGGAI